MNKRRVFYVVYFADPFVQSCLDLIRYLAEWSEKTPAHITVRGPYNRRLPSRIEQNIDAKIAGINIDILGASAFLGQHQNTVYFQCSATELSQVWYKPNYPFNPHLTLYDGDDKAFADDLLAGLRSYPGQFSITARGVDYIVSVRGERALPTIRLSIEQACRELNIKLENDVSKHNHRDIRLNQIFVVYHALQNYCNKISRFSANTTYEVMQLKHSHTHLTSASHLPYRIVARKKHSLIGIGPKS